MTHHIRTGTPDDLTLIATTIADAFQHLPVAYWLVPNPEQRHTVLQANMEIWVSHALAGHGTAEIITDGTGTGVAVWFPYTDTPAPAPADYDTRLEAGCGEHATRFRRLDAAFAAHHPHQPHHHLAFLAITPEHQGRGLGTALLKHHHDSHPHTATYLEASSAPSRRLYLRHCYRDHEDQPFTPASDNDLLRPDLWPMWRDPHSTT